MQTEIINYTYINKKEYGCSKNGCYVKGMAEMLWTLTNVDFFILGEKIPKYLQSGFIFDIHTVLLSAVINAS